MNSIGIDNIRQAADRLAGKVIATPLLSSPQLDEMVGARILVKAENLQRTGAFKIRGALNKILSLPADRQQRGVVTFSAGNHGQGVAAAARQVGCPAVIVLPANAPRIKINNCRWWGAHVVLYDPLAEDREIVAQHYIDTKGMTLIHPFDDPEIMAGQGTLGLELCEQALHQGHDLDAVAVACSGGGLAAGVAAAVTNTFPDIALWLAEPAGGEKMRRSLESGQPQRNAPGKSTIMDAINGPVVGTTTLQNLQGHNTECLGITDDMALRAIKIAFEQLKIVVEPGGAAALAAVVHHAGKFQGQTVAVVCSGGNVDPDVFIDALNHP